jgi:hypothetical protein
MMLRRTAPRTIRKIAEGRGFFCLKIHLHSVKQLIAGLDERRKLLLALRPEIQEFSF